RSPGSRVVALGPAFPRLAPVARAAVASWGGLAAHSCGGSHGFEASPLPCSLLPERRPKAGARTPAPLLFSHGLPDGSQWMITPEMAEATRSLPHGSARPAETETYPGPAAGRPGGPCRW